MLPAHFDTAYICVKIKQGSYAYGKSHYFIKLRPLGWIQIEHVEDELPQLRAVAVGNWRECSTHDLQNKRWQILKAK